MKHHSYQDWLKVARRHSRVAHEAEDLLQDSLLIAWRQQRNPLDQPAADDAAWFAGVIRKQAAFRARSAVRARQREQACGPIDATPPEAAEIEAWRQLAGELPAAQRQVLLLALHGLGRKEICRVLGITDASLRQRLASLRKRLDISATDLAAVAAGCAARILTANPDDAGLRRAVLNRGPQSIPGFRFGVSDPDGYMVGIAADSRPGSSQNSVARQQTDETDPPKERKT